MTPVMTRAEARIRNDRIVAMYEAGHTTAEIASIMRLSGSEFVREILTQRGVAFEPVESPHAKRMNAWRKATKDNAMTLAHDLGKLVADEINENWDMFVETRRKMQRGELW